MARLDPTGVSRILTYIKTWITGLLSNKSDSSHTHSDYVPKSGGAVLNNTSWSRTTNDDYLLLNGGTTWENGAHIVLNGKNRASGGGDFFIHAKNDSYQYTLAGGVDGTLTWGNKEIDTIEEQGNNYIRYSSGLQICWGQTSCLIDTTISSIVINTNYNTVYYGYKTVNFGSAFKAGTSPYCTLAVIDKASGIYGSCIADITNALVEIEIYGPNHSVSLDVQYIAIGRWK